MENTENIRQNSEKTEIRIRGRNRMVPSAIIQDRDIVVANHWPRIALLKDEEFVERDAFDDASSFFDSLKRSSIRADLFTFLQRFPEIKPRYNYPMEWDNVASLEVLSHTDWLQNKINGNQRKILRRSERRGVSVSMAPLDDAFVHGVMDIYNESPVRQGRPFWHYGKDFSTVKSELSTYIDRSVFLGAYFEERLIGFAKIVAVGRVGRLMHILSMISHMDKLPMNSLISGAIQICEARQWTHLTYGKYSYGRVRYTSLTEFKVRNGFTKVEIPRYYMPLTLQGKLAIKLGIHQGMKYLVPEPLFRFLLSARAKVSRLRVRNREQGEKDHSDSHKDAGVEPEKSIVSR